MQFGQIQPFFGEDLHHYARFLYINQSHLIDLSTFVHQKYTFCTFYLTLVPKLSLFTRFSWGKIQFKDFALCKRIDISQLWDDDDDNVDHTASCQSLLSELRNVKSFTRSKIPDLNFTPRKARKQQQFWHLSEMECANMIVLLYKY